MALKRPESEFVRTVSEYNLSTYYLLPLIQLNKFSFGDANFIDSYVNREGTILTVELSDLRLSESFSKHPDYITEKNGNVRGYIWFTLPTLWQPDFKHFTSGKYSMFSEQAKGMIRAFSDLTFQEPDPNNIIITDARLLALDKSSALRKKWEEELEMTLPEGVELMSIPDEKQYREFED